MTTNTDTLALLREAELARHEAGGATSAMKFCNKCGYYGPHATHFIPSLSETRYCDYSAVAAQQPKEPTK